MAQSNEQLNIALGEILRNMESLTEVVKELKTRVEKLEKKT